MATYRDPAICALVAYSDVLQRLSDELQEQANLLSRRLADLRRRHDDGADATVVSERGFSAMHVFVRRGASR